MTDALTGLAIPWVAVAIITLLHLVIPGRWVDGYVLDAQTGKPLRYRLNGLRVLVVTVALWFGACTAGWLPWDLLYTHRWWSLAGAVIMGLLFTGAIVFTAPPTEHGLGRDLWLGRRENPQWRGGRIDAKMWLYLVGAVLLALNLLSFAAAHHLRHPEHANTGVVLYVGLFAWFLCEYLFFERVHLYTWDFIAEGVGFKLGWGCLAFYPYFYAVGLWALVDAPDPGRPWFYDLLAVVVFFAGWGLARGANMQKYTYKTRPDARFLGVLEPQVVTDGERSLLLNGWWGVSRHVNYLGEILMACGLALALGYPLHPAPWLYALYYVGLLFPRQYADDKRCAAKYGPLWDDYVKAVPYRIIPGVY
jgi:protein-S-isoprenylcysteine O-methyltransferase Ste14